MGDNSHSVCRCAAIAAISRMTKEICRVVFTKSAKNAAKVPIDFNGKSSGNDLTLLKKKTLWGPTHSHTQLVK